MARVNNLSNFLTDVASAIKTKKGSETNIPAANFDTEILALPSQGVYEQRVLNISANGSQTITPGAGFDAIDELTLTVAVPEKQLQSKTYNFTQNTNIELLPDTGYDGFDSVTLNINVPGGTINNQDKTITQNGVYTADSGYTGLGEVTVNVQNSNIKIYDTYNDMISDNTAVENNIGLVYSSSFEPLQLNQKISAISYEDSFTLDEAITSSSSKTIRIKNDDATVTLNVSIGTKTIQCNMTINFNNISYSWRPKWTSSDGINYTISTSATNPMPLRYLCIVSSLPSEPYLSIINTFLKVNNLTFGGLYKYYNTADTDYYNMVTGMSYNETYSSTNNIVYLPKLKNDIEYILYECNDIKSSTIGIYRYNNNNYIVRNYIYAMYDTTDNNTYLVVNASNETVNDVVRYYYNVANMDTSTEFTKIICDDNDRIGTTSYFKIGLLSQYNYIVDGTVSNVSDDMTFTISRGSTPVFAYTDGTNFTRININNNPGLKYGYVEFLGWHNIIGSTSARFDYQIYDTSVFGKNRLIVGNKNILNHISNTDFSNKWLDGHTSTTSTYATYNIGDTVKTQTLVSRERIPWDVDNSISSADSIISTYDSSRTDTLDWNDDVSMRQYISRSQVLDRTTTVYNNIMYEVEIRADIDTSSSSNFNQIINPVFILFNTFTGEVVKIKELNQTFYVCPQQKPGCIAGLDYDFDNDCWRFISKTATGWTLDGGNPYALFTVFDVSTTSTSVNRYDISYRITYTSTVNYGKINYCTYDQLNKLWYTNFNIKPYSGNAYHYSLVSIGITGNISELYRYSNTISGNTIAFKSYGQAICLCTNLDTTDNSYTMRVIDGLTGNTVLNDTHQAALTWPIEGICVNNDIAIMDVVNNKTYKYNTSNKQLTKVLDTCIRNDKYFIINNVVYYTDSNSIYTTDFTDTKTWYGFNSGAANTCYYNMSNNVFTCTKPYRLMDITDNKISRNYYGGIKCYRYFIVDTLPVSTELLITMNTRQYQAKRLTYIPDVNNNQNQEEEVEE